MSIITIKTLNSSSNKIYCKYGFAEIFFGNFSPADNQANTMTLMNDQTNLSVCWCRSTFFLVIRHYLAVVNV